MSRAIVRVICAALLSCGVGASAAARQAGAGVQASQTGQTGQTSQTVQAGGGARPGEVRVPLTDEALALDADGRVALAGRLRTTQLTGTPEAPGRNSRLVIENRSQFFYNYVSGWATFYDGTGVRCGEGLWKVEALAPAELAEVDTPGLRLTCTPTTWRVAAINLLTRTTDVAKPADRATPPPDTPDASAGQTAPADQTPTRATLPPLEININGKTIPIQPGNPLEITVGKERVRIVLNPAPQ